MSIKRDWGFSEGVDDWLVRVIEGRSEGRPRNCTGFIGSGRDVHEEESRSRGEPAPRRETDDLLEHEIVSTLI